MNKGVICLYLAIFFLSQAILAYEVVLIRLLDIIQFSEVSSIIISLALLGFGYSGIFCYFFKDRIKPPYFILSSLLLFLFSLPFCFYLTQVTFFLYIIAIILLFYDSFAKFIYL